MIIVRTTRETVINDSVIVICSRPESSRLPRKVFKHVAGVPSIEHILTRISGCDIQTIIAVPVGCKEYDYLVDKFSNNLNISIFYGDPESPLHRMYAAVQSLESDIKWVIRITHDDILIDQMTMLNLLEKAKSVNGAGYAITPKIVDGAGVEIFRFENLEHAAKNTNHPTEYISYFVKNKPFSEEIHMDCRPSIERSYRLTMDYESDYVLINFVLKKVGPFADLDKVVSFLDMNPYLLEINKKPLISIYTCAYNAEKYIDKCLSSVLSKSHFDMDIEYILIDDGSTDDTLLIASKYAHHKNFKIISNEKNMGLAYSSNKAIRKANGKYVLRIDADDWMITPGIRIMYDEILESGAGIVYPSFQETDEHGNALGDIKNPSMFHHPGCALMDKRMIDEIMFTDGIKHYDGLDLYKRIQNHNFKVDYIYGIPLWYYRKHKGSLSANDTPERIKAYEDLNKIIPFVPNKGKTNE